MTNIKNKAPQWYNIAWHLFFKPSQAIEYINKKGKLRYALFLIFLYFISLEIVSLLRFEEITTTLSTGIIGVFVHLLATILYVLLVVKIFHSAGKSLGGVARYKSLVNLYGYSFLPFFIGLYFIEILVNVLQYIISVPLSWFTQATTNGQTILLVLNLLLVIAGAIYSVVFFSKGLVQLNKLKKSYVFYNWFMPIFFSILSMMLSLLFFRLSYIGYPLQNFLF